MRIDDLKEWLDKKGAARQAARFILTHGHAKK